MKPTIQGAISLAIFGVILYIFYLIVASFVSGTILSLIAVIFILVFLATAIRILEIPLP
jgi:hypothetical protein